MVTEPHLPPVGDSDVLSSHTPSLNNLFSLRLSRPPRYKPTTATIPYHSHRPSNSSGATPLHGPGLMNGITDTHDEPDRFLSLHTGFVSQKAFFNT